MYPRRGANATQVGSLVRCGRCDEHHEGALWPQFVEQFVERTRVPILRLDRDPELSGRADVQWDSVSPTGTSVHDHAAHTGSGLNGWTVGHHIVQLDGREPRLWQCGDDARRHAATHRITLVDQVDMDAGARVDEVATCGEGLHPSEPKDAASQPSTDARDGVDELRIHGAADQASSRSIAGLTCDAAWSSPLQAPARKIAIWSAMVISSSSSVLTTITATPFSRANVWMIE